MKRMMMGALSMMMMAGMAVQPTFGAESGEGKSAFAHAVFFTLAEPTDENRERLIVACRQYLSGHDGELSFVVGARAVEMQREVNVLDFDVSLHIVFESKAAHDRYQTHPRHLEFVAGSQSLWKGVRVFDSLVE